MAEPSLSRVPGYSPGMSYIRGVQAINNAGGLRPRTRQQLKAQLRSTIGRRKSNGGNGG